MIRSTTTSKGHRCARCPTIIVGNLVVCEACHAKARLCRTCKRPHGGKPATTKYCPPCRAGRRRKKGKYPRYTPADDARIRAVYATHHGRRGGQGATRILARELGRPGWSISRRAMKLGLLTVRAADPRWSEAELALLREIGWQVPERVARAFKLKGFQRTATAIAVMSKRLRVHDGIDGSTAHGFADLLGIDVHTVTRWIERSWLDASRTGAKRKGREVTWYITREAARTFLRTHPEVIDFGKIERAGSKAWLVEMLTGTPSAAVAAPAASNAQSVERTVALYGERVTLLALAQIAGRSVDDLLERIDGQGMSVLDAAFGEAGMGPLAAPSGHTRALQAEFRALMRRHRAKVADVARWVELPEEAVRLLLDGEVPLVPPAVGRILDVLQGVLRIEAR